MPAAERHTGLETAAPVRQRALWRRQFILAATLILAAPRSAVCQKATPARDGGGVTTLFDSIVMVRPQPVWLPLVGAVKTAASFNVLCIAIPIGYSENLDRMSMDAPSGHSVSFWASVRLGDSTEIPMDFSGFSHWRAPNGKVGRGYCLNLSKARNRIPIGTMLTGLMLWSNEPIELNEIVWLSFN